MTSISLLHLSDLHLMNALYEDQRVVLDALYEDLQAHQATNGAIDAIFFTGDLVGKGTFTTEILGSLQDKFFSPLRKATGVAEDKIFMVPGNHDVEQEKKNRIAKFAIENLKSNEDVNGTLDDPSSVAVLSAAFENFNTLRDSFVKSPRIFKTPLFESYAFDFGGKKIGIAAINSAWCATGKAEGADYGKLLIGGRQIEQLARSIKDCDFRFALLHHPFQWLAEFDQSNVQRQIFNNFDAVFFGHNHHADVLSLARPSGTMFVSNAGCLYQGRGYFNAYTILKFELNALRWHVRVREYYEDRQKFGASERFADGGEQVYDISNERATGVVSELPTEEYLTAITETLNSQLLSYSVSDIAPQSLMQLFVVPPLFTISERQLGSASADNPRGEPILLSKLISENSIVIFVGTKESGKTTLLNYICAQANDVTAGNPMEIGAHVNLNSLGKHTRAGLIQAIVNFSNGAYSRSHFIKMLELGRMTICLDNLDFEDSRLVKVVQEFIAEYHKNRFFVSTLEDVRTSLVGNSAPKLGDNQRIAYIHSFGRKQTRELMQRWFQGSDTVASEDVDNILASLKKLNIPRTPFLISIFLWVHERNIAFDPVNHVEVIDTLVDGMLDKFHESKSRSRLDSTAKRHFLTDLAYHLYQLGRDSLTPNELEIFTADYFKSKLLTASSAPFIEELTRKGIFLDLGDAILFKFDCLRAFFLSVRLQESSNFFDEALTTDKYLLLGQEIDYFTAKQRGREDALRKALDVLDEYYSPIKVDLDLALFDQINAEDIPVSEEVRSDLEKELFPKRLSEENREDFLDQMDARATPVAERGVSVPATTLQGSVPDFVRALEITSAVLRNSELINDGALKRSAYQRITRYWCELLLIAVLAIELREDSDAFIELKNSLPMFNGQQFGYLLKLIAPNVVSNLMFESLGTSQLEVVIKDHANDAEHSVERLVSTILQIDLSLPGYLDAVDKFSKSSANKKFSDAILLMKILQRYIFKPMPTSEVDRLQKLMGELFLSQRPGGGTQVNILYRNQLIATVVETRKTNLNQKPSE